MLLYHSTLWLIMTRPTWLLCSYKSITIEWSRIICTWDWQFLSWTGMRKKWGGEKKRLELVWDFQLHPQEWFSTKYQKRNNEHLCTAYFSHMVLRHDLWLTTQMNQLKACHRRMKRGLSLRDCLWKVGIRHAVARRDIEMEVWVKNGAGLSMWSKWIHSNWQGWLWNGTHYMDSVGVDAL